MGETTAKKHKLGYFKTVVHVFPSNEDLSHPQSPAISEASMQPSQAYKRVCAIHLLRIACYPTSPPD